ncbi:hypothetical protein VTN02DRAFT_3464 [Thermoascus thermophilus]
MTTTPYHVLLIILLLLAFSPSTSYGLDFDFFQNSACTSDQPHVSCMSIPAATCCTGGSPWCAYVRGNGLPEGRAMRTYNKSDCGGSIVQSCKGQRPPAYCCADLGGGSQCATYWQAGVARRDDEDASPVCTRRVQPNRMVYTDATGLRQEIHLPKGTVDEATGYLQAGDFEGLAKYPAWANQAYEDEEDTESIPLDP